MHSLFSKGGNSIPAKIIMSDILKDTDGSCGQQESLIECFRCGICCSRYQVRLSLAEVQHIADELAISREEFVEKYTDYRWPSTKSFLVRQNRGACIFLRHDTDGNITSCLIHTFRPASCRKWKPSQYQTECQEGLYKYWGLKVSPDGKIKGNKSSIQRFQAFLKSLKHRPYSRERGGSKEVV